MRIFPSITSSQEPKQGKQLKPSSGLGLSVRNPPKAIPKEMQGGLFGDQGGRERHEIMADSLSETCSRSDWRGLYDNRMGLLAIILESSLMPKFLVLCK